MLSPSKHVRWPLPAILRQAQDDTLILFSRFFKRLKFTLKKFTPGMIARLRGLTPGLFVY